MKPSPSSRRKSLSSAIRSTNFADSPDSTATDDIEALFYTNKGLLRNPFARRLSSTSVANVRSTDLYTSVNNDDVITKNNFFSPLKEQFFIRKNYKMPLSKTTQDSSSTRCTTSTRAHSLTANPNSPSSFAKKISSTAQKQNEFDYINEDDYSTVRDSVSPAMDKLNQNSCISGPRFNESIDQTALTCVEDIKCLLLRNQAIKSYALVDECYFSSMETLLKKINNWDFNIFFFDQICGGRGFIILALHLFNIYDFWTQFQLQPINVYRFLNLVHENYLEANPYHNSLHAADVTQALHCLIQEEKWNEFFKPDELLSVIVAALCHDVNHPGLNQQFLVKTNDLLSLLQKEPILENHHCSMTVSLLNQSKIFAHLPKLMRKNLHAQIQSFILATDITKHQDFLIKFRSRIGVFNSFDVSPTSAADTYNVVATPDSSITVPVNTSTHPTPESSMHDLSLHIPADAANLLNRGSIKFPTHEKLKISESPAKESVNNGGKQLKRLVSFDNSSLSTKGPKTNLFDLQQAEHRHFLLQIALKCSDISNPARQWTISQRWSRMICQELFNQGDIERLIKLPVTTFCDRTQTSIAQMQEGFLEYVVLPIFAEWHRYVESDLSDQIITNITSNKKRWAVIMKEIESPFVPILEESEEALEQSLITANSSPKSSAQLMAEYENIAVDVILWRRYSVPLSLPKRPLSPRRRSYPKFKKVKWHTIFEEPNHGWKMSVDAKRRATIDAILLDRPAIMGYDDKYSFDVAPSKRRFSLFANSHFLSSTMMTKINRLTRQESFNRDESPLRKKSYIPRKSLFPDRGCSFALDDSINNPNDTSFSLLNRNLALIYVARQKSFRERQGQ